MKLDRWLSERPHVLVGLDVYGNRVLRARDEPEGGTPVYITAHMDHPAFVVRSVEDSTVHLDFRGGVRDEYFPGAAIEIHCYGEPARAVIESAGPRDPDRPVVAILDDPSDAKRDLTQRIATWALPEPEIEGDTLRTNACDDLAALCAALEAFDELVREDAEPLPAPVRLLFTRAEEIGFLGAIAACREGTIEPGARVIALENSRSYPQDSPIGGGPILRVGDRLSTFDPALTSACGRVAEGLAKEDEFFVWQRKLMPGGACEATAFGAYGYSATCLCLPLGNYHNMGNLAEVENDPEYAGDHAAIEREYISLNDYRGLVRSLVAIGRSDLEPTHTREKMEEMFRKREFDLPPRECGTGLPEDGSIRFSNGWAQRRERSMKRREGGR